MNKTNNKLKDHSRFNRWVQNLDEKDKSLSPLVRKSKWVLIMTSVFVLFGLSFIVFPRAKINSDSFQAPFEITKKANEQTSAQSAFELPVDSFENQLIRIIYEKISEKE
jgi:hypothetical protein